MAAQRVSSRKLRTFTALLASLHFLALDRYPCFCGLRSPVRAFPVPNLLQAHEIGDVADAEADITLDSTSLVSEVVMPWEVWVSKEEGEAGQLHLDTLVRAVEALNSTGFAVLRGSSLFTENDLDQAQAGADAALLKVKDQAEARGLLSHVPWPRMPGGRRAAKGGNVFKFKEALSYTPGRLDMPDLCSTPPFHRRPLHQNSNLIRLCEMLFGRPCEQSVVGALWNFPRSGPPYWHRDGELPLLTAVTAALDYPEEVGFIHLQPYTQAGACDEASNSLHAPQVSDDSEAAAVPAVLKRGETLLFLYTTKHAATPNLSDLERCLLYSVYGPANTRDHVNFRPSWPSLFTSPNSKVKSKYSSRRKGRHHG